MEVQKLTATRDELASTGAWAEVTRCGGEFKPCIAVDEAAGAFERTGSLGSREQFCVIQGY